MYSCDQVIAELANFLDDELPAEVRRELELHLSHCRTCQALYDSTRKTIRIVTESGSFELPEKVSERIVNNILARAGSTRKRRKKPSKS